jgi:hypothetical protein
MDDIIYEVGLNDKTGEVIDRINKKLEQVAERQANISRVNVPVDPKFADAFKTIAEKAAAKPIKFNVSPVNPFPAGFADKFATEAEGGLRRVDRGLNRTFGGLGQLMAGNFRIGMMQIGAGIREMTGRSTEALGQIAGKAAAIGGAFAGGFAIGGAIDELFGISDKIAKNFEATLDPITEYRDKMREISAVNLSNLVTEFEKVAEASKKANEEAGITRDIKVAQARRDNNSGAEWMAEKENIEEREQRAQGDISQAEKRKRQLDSDVESAKENFRKLQSRNAPQNEQAQAVATIRNAQAAQRAGVPLADKLINENRTALRRIEAEKIDSETKANKTIADQKEATDKKETDRKEKEKDKIDAIFERRDKKVADVKRDLNSELHRQTVAGLEDANRADAAKVEKSRDRQEKLAKVIAEKTELEQMTSHERREAKQTTRAIENEKKRDKHRQDLLEKSALRAQERIDKGGLGGKLSKRQEEALEAIKARQDLKNEKKIAEDAQKQIDDRNKRLATLAEEASLERLEQIRLLGLVVGKLSLQ